MRSQILLPDLDTCTRSVPSAVISLTTLLTQDRGQAAAAQSLVPMLSAVAGGAIFTSNILRPTSWGRPPSSSLVLSPTRSSNASTCSMQPVCRSG
jgi:hypothetical protein